MLRALVPNVETLGYYRTSLRDKDVAPLREYSLRHYLSIALGFSRGLLPPLPVVAFVGRSTEAFCE